jgi:hypothetical protein
MIKDIGLYATRYIIAVENRISTTRCTEGTYHRLRRKVGNIEYTGKRVQKYQDGRY